MRRNWAAGDGRVVQLRTEKYSALKRQTSVTSTRIFGDKGLPANQTFPTDELSIFPADLQHGTEPFKTSPAVQETLVQWQHRSICCESTMWCAAGSEFWVKCIILKLKSKSEAKRARRRGIEEQHSGQ
jgi:hypothetical protein